MAATIRKPKSSRNRSEEFCGYVDEMMHILHHLKSLVDDVRMQVGKQQGVEAVVGLDAYRKEGTRQAPYCAR